MTRAIPWDGVGPKESCLLRIRWAHLDFEGWSEFTFEPDGYYEHVSREFAVYPDIGGDAHGGPGLGRGTVTHYAALPTIATVNRIENDPVQKDGAS